MKIEDIVKTKGPLVWTVKANQTIQEAVHLLSSRGVGSLIVIDEPFGDVAGILSERDIVRGCNISLKPLIGVRVSDWMTRNIITCTPSDEVREIMGIMTQHRIRHVPVVEDGEVIALISIGDVVKAILEESTSEIQFLKEYAFGAPSD